MKVIRDTIIKRHIHDGEIDKEQLDAVFSKASHLVVEAPAGHGKTRTMVSKIAYLIASGQVPYPKKILALTFSINAAFKIRKDVRDELPAILSENSTLSRENEKTVYATNYHGLCRRILGRYGYLISPELSLVNEFKGVGINIYDDESYTIGKVKKNLREWGITLTPNEISQLIKFTRAIQEAGDKSKRPEASKYLSKHLNNYLEIVKKKFLPQKYILHDAVLLFVRKLFANHSEILGFYKLFFHTIIVDEFQDTNILQWSLLQDMVGRNDENKNSLFIFGDRNQKIYEFIGAMEGIIDVAKDDYKMQEVKLTTNHRFKNNTGQLLFDRNLREIIKNIHSPNIDINVDIEIDCAKNQKEEAKQILSHIKTLLEQNKNSTIAVLMFAGKENKNTIEIIKHFNEENFSYFFALYGDEDEEYIDFHQKCLTSLYLHQRDVRSFAELSKLVEKDISVNEPSETWKSLQTLLRTFFALISEEFREFSLEDKISNVKDTLENKSLKQYLMYVTNSQVTLSTIHGAKGLEWDYVILPDMEKNSFPSYPSLCKHCKYNNENCVVDWTQIKMSDNFHKALIKNLNVFYVGGTRAKKKTYFTHSSWGINSKGNPRKNHLSCFLQLKGLQIDSSENHMHN